MSEAQNISFTHLEEATITELQAAIEQATKARKVPQYLPTTL